MNVDWFFTKGFSHNVCEDYVAVGGEGDEHRVVLADGCSSVKNSDVGARLLCHTAFNYLPDLSKALIVAAGNAYNLGLRRSCLCATLLTIEGFYDGPVVTAHGDGFIVAKTREGRLDWWKMEYSGGAPWYPIYSLDASEVEAWKALGQTFTVEKHKGNEVETEEVEMDPGGIIGRFDPFDYEVVMVLSDGVGTFIDNSEGRRTPVPVEEVLAELVKVRNFKGEFLKRRCQGFLKMAKKKGWEHIDDFSVGAMYLGLEPTGDIDPS